MEQIGYKYTNMAEGRHLLIYNRLRKNYGDNVVWPILWYLNDQIRFITFEINQNDSTNESVSTEHDILNYLDQDIEVYKVDYTNNNSITQLRGTQINSIVQASAAPQFRSSHEYISSNNNNNGYRTIDIDYLWIQNKNVFGLEVSTFKVAMKDRDKAEFLVGQVVSKRQTLSRQLKNLFNNPFGANMRMAFFNQDNAIGGTALIENGNVIYFDIDINNVALVSCRKMPENILFTNYANFFERL